MKNRSLLWTLLISLLSAVSVSVGGVVYTGLSNAETNRQWCELLTPLETAYSSAPPQTELGRRVALAIHGLAERFDCKEDS